MVLVFKFGIVVVVGEDANNGRTPTTAGNLAF